MLGMQRHLQCAADLQRLGPGAGLLSLGDGTGGQHAQQHRVLALGGACQVGDRVGITRVLRQAGQHRRFGQAQGRQRLAEVGIGGGGKTVSALAEVDLVHVQLQNLVLAQLALDLQGQQRFFQLALGRQPGRQEKRPRHLLGDGGRALAQTPGGGGQQRAQHAFGVDAQMLAEACVLHRQQRLLQLQRDGADRHKLPALGAKLGDLHAVGGDHLQRLAWLVAGDPIQRRQLRRVPGHRAGQQQPGGQQQGQRPAQRQPPAPGWAAKGWGWAGKAWRAWHDGVGAGLDGSRQRRYRAWRAGQHGPRWWARAGT